MIQEKNKKQTAANPAPGIDDKIQYAVRVNADLTKDQIREGIRGDLKAIVVTLLDIVEVPEVMNAITEIYWKRYSELHQKTYAKPEDDAL